MDFYPNEAVYCASDTGGRHLEELWPLGLCSWGWKYLKCKSECGSLAYSVCWRRCGRHARWLRHRRESVIEQHAGDIRVQVTEATASPHISCFIIYRSSDGYLPGKGWSVDSQDYKERHDRIQALYSAGPAWGERRGLGRHCRQSFWAASRPACLPTDR